MKTLSQILASLGLPAADETLLVVGLPQDVERAAVTCLGRLASADEISPELRVDTGLVVEQLEHLDSRAGAHLLSRLRDVHCKRVFLLLRNGKSGNTDWSRDTLLAMGFTQQRPDARLGAELYLYEPEVFNPPREWNNARDWANPENFRKYRW